jgi:hypothetical protein
MEIVIIIYRIINHMIPCIKSSSFLRGASQGGGGTAHADAFQAHALSSSVKRCLFVKGWQREIPRKTMGICVYIFYIYI